MLNVRFHYRGRVLIGCRPGGALRLSLFSRRRIFDYLADRRTIQRNFRRRLEVLLPHVNAPRTKRLFEVGSAYGLFLEVAREQFAE